MPDIESRSEPDWHWYRSFLLVTETGSLSAAARELGLTYSTFMNGLRKAAIEVDRKVLADLAVFDKPAFAAIAEQARAKLAA